MHHVGILYDQFMMHGQRNIKSRQMEEKKSLFLHHDNAPPHTSLVRQFLTSKNITVIPHPSIRLLRLFPFPQNEITPERESF